MNLAKNFASRRESLRDSRQDRHCEFASRRESWRDSTWDPIEILAAGIFTSRRESQRDSRQDRAKILAAGIFASWRDSRHDPGEILAAGNFTSQRESCWDPAGIATGNKNSGGESLAGIPAGFPPRSQSLFLQGKTIHHLLLCYPACKVP